MKNDGVFEKSIKEKKIYNHLNQLTNHNILFSYLLSILLLSFIIKLYMLLLV
jgi:hypothetical protein